MSLTYDFDMVAMGPEGMHGQPRAMFRDPRTVAALNMADEAVRAYFLASGFVIQAHDSGAPPGRFAQRDEDARAQVIESLSANLATHNLEGVNWGGFAFPAFMQALSKAEPVPDELLAPPLQRDVPNPELAAANEASRKLRMRRMTAFSGLTVGLILLVFVVAQLLI